MSGRKIALTTKTKTMGRLSYLLFSGFILLACNNSANETTSADSTGAPVKPGIDNVNGNIPDTGSAIQLNEPLPKDSSNLDSTKH